ncbi:MAG: preprotein translocase subunit SecA [Kiritimatiellae bacterium]|nr:preprotein translocase subunit SecA [Kiritimatiellia bacterium]
MNILKMIFGTKNARDLKKLRPIVDEINRIEAEYQARNLTDEDFPKMTAEFRRRLEAREVTLDGLLPEAFALVKNACRHLVGTTAEVCGHTLTWDMVPFDCQLVGGIVLHQGKIAEMQTGEGKTLVATLPLYLNALTGKNVQLVTVNDYLALRDATWMGHLFKYLGLTVGCIQNTMDSAERYAQYRCDITYGTNSEFGFDYLRDNGMATSPEQVVQNGHHFAIVDEVDSILIDEARTPLIISGPATMSTSAQYTAMKPLVETIVRIQTQQCNDFIAQAKKALAAGEEWECKRRLYQVYHSMPKHKQMLHMYEDASIRKLHEDVEMQMLSEMHKEEGRALKEELYFTIDERTREVALTDKGCDKMNPQDPKMFVIPDLAGEMSQLDGDHEMSAADKAEKKRVLQADFMERSARVHVVDQLLRAYCLYERDVDYVVQPDPQTGVGHVYIVDEFTGRILPGRRWSDGLHQAVEAKEGVEIEKESQTLATITIQNYFRLYKKLAGMTGTAETEAREFKDIYKLDVTVIPTNRPIRRIDGNDQIYRTQREKYKAIIAEVQERHAAGQPVLLGTVTVDTSEVLSRLLKVAKIPHEVLNAKNHAREAEIVTLAGQPGAVTIATNMAGRGTDIKLGPGVVTLPQEVVKSQLSLKDRLPGTKDTIQKILEAHPQGLHVIGSERHESRRIDRQLRGRCSRQGDPGSSQFYISLEDNLMRLFGSQKLSGIMQRLGMKEGEVMEHRWLNKSVETAQRRVEQQHYAIRKRTLEYDDVMNKQRSIVYELRGTILSGTPETVHGTILDVFNDLILTQCERYLSDPKNPGLEDFSNWLGVTFPVTVSEDELKPFLGEPAKAADLVYSRVQEAYEGKCASEDQSVLPYMERGVFISCIDRQWQDYLRAMDDLRHGVSLRSYGQRDPLVEYKREAFGMFENLMNTIKTEVANLEFRATTASNMRRMIAAAEASQANVRLSGGESALESTLGGQHPAAQPAPRPAQAQQGASAPKSVNDVFASMINQVGGGGIPRPMRAPRPPRAAATVGRNDPCPCGSGKKYKKCCGRGQI